MYTTIVLATLVFALQIRQGYPATACATPGMYLSTDNQYCFGFAEITREWNYHISMCRAYNAKLVNINSSDKQTMVETFLAEQSLSSSSKVFIGLTNIVGDVNDWLWDGGNITSYTNWGSSEPTNSYRYNCAYMLISDYKWYSLSCLTNSYGLCERDATSADVV